ncbi:MAG: sodium/solute symporter [Gammaproteobacteria bacterium]|uniref:sodium/sugar symporter n=1 Tax=Pseudomaricurvus alcaniphilus TaxID=1166482 RepID=UPI00140A8E6A|nr:sodium/sugar symporter [Pseudomaricurvus alcaniphilus]MBR9911531.1 sodium/solute symporter [Gammaproteobacteria bacterium]NHN35904.1 sodium/solute symporter [Pseudomaricurvus alcaniphilus]
MNLATLDVVVVAAYCIGLVTIASLVSREKKGHEKDSQDYFLAGRSLPWWAIGASLIAANISAEQIIGMTGSGYAIGLAIASYEWTAAIALLVIGKYFVPIYLEKNIYTMPEFLEKRYDHRVRILLAFFWVGVYIFVNLTSVLYLGALTIEIVAGVDMLYGMLFLAALSLAYSLYGGLKAVAFTDIIQVAILIVGGIAVTFLSLDKLSEGAGVIAGFTYLLDNAPQKFDMILASDHPSYMDLPGISVLVGGLWIAQFSYWGFNQYITQRALAAKNLREAQKGIALAAFLKLFMPFIVVIPGIAAFLLAPNLDVSDKAYPELMKLLPAGLFGLTFAALIAAIVSSLSSMTNSISTIFTMDIYRSTFQHVAVSEKGLVRMGRCAALVSLIIAMLVARPLLGNLDQAFQYIQEFTGFFSPGILVIFLFGLFWGKATAHSALAAAIVSVVVSLAFKLWLTQVPFLDRMGLAFLVSAIAAIAITLYEHKGDHPKAVRLEDFNFKTSAGFNISSLAVVLILVAFYSAWW